MEPVYALNAVPPMVRVFVPGTERSPAALMVGCAVAVLVCVAAGALAAAQPVSIAPATTTVDVHFLSIAVFC